MPARLRRLAWLCALVGALLTGCNSARHVAYDSSGGVVAIPSNSNCWPNYHRKHAEELIQARCPGGYVIDHEEEVVVGTTQHTDVTTETRGDPLLAALRVAPITEETRQQTTNHNLTEWRIAYRKANPVAPPRETGPAPAQPK